jgi:hypothetical protein
VSFWHQSGRFINPHPSVPSKREECRPFWGYDEKSWGKVWLEGRKLLNLRKKK